MKKGLLFGLGALAGAFATTGMIMSNGRKGETIYEDEQIRIGSCTGGKFTNNEQIAYIQMKDKKQA